MSLKNIQVLHSVVCVLLTVLLTVKTCINVLLTVNKTMQGSEKSVKKVQERQLAND
jgi:hypothetical protein